MAAWWIKFGCFLTGYNYAIVRNSSEVAAKAVKRYTAAVLIVSILWAFIGFTFTQRYLHGGMAGSAFGALIAVVMVVQIERQIILSIHPSKWLYVFRGLIAAMMALLGAIIIDQIIFKEDIELEKITYIEERVRKALPPKTEELRAQLQALDTAINAKERERIQLIADVERNPTIASISSQQTPTVVRQSVRDSSGRTTTRESVRNVTTVSRTDVPNPKQALIVPVEKTIAELRLQKDVKEKALLNIRPQLEKEISSRVGFLDELQIMYKLLTGSGIALVVWLLWFFFLFGLEMLVLISKVNDRENDYERTVKHHMELQMRKLDILAKRAEGG